MSNRTSILCDSVTDLPVIITVVNGVPTFLNSDGTAYVAGNSLESCCCEDKSNILENSAVSFDSVANTPLPVGAGTVVGDTAVVSHTNGIAAFTWDGAAWQFDWFNDTSATFTINSGTTNLITDNVNGEATINAGDTIHFWSPDSTILFSVVDGSAIVGADAAGIYHQNNTGGNIPAVLVDPTLIVSPKKADAVVQEYDDGYVLSIFDGAAWTNLSISTAGGAVSNGISLDAATQEHRLGDELQNDAASAFTSDRYINLDAFALELESTNGDNFPTARFESGGDVWFGADGSANAADGTNFFYTFDKSKGSIYSGITGTATDITGMGLASFASGSNLIVTGGGSGSFGQGNTVSGDVSFSSGLNNVSSGQRSFTSGALNTASGDFSFAFGQGATASGSASTAWGGATASNVLSTAWGGGISTAQNSTAWSLGTANGTFSTAVGTGTVIDGGNTHAFGLNLTADALSTQSFLTGRNNSLVGSDSSFANGQDNSLADSQQFATGLTNVLGINAARAAVFGNQNNITGSAAGSAYNAFATGNLNVVDGESSFAQGIGHNISTKGMAVFGHWSTITAGDPLNSVATDEVFKVGIGASNLGRADALRIYKNGSFDMPSYGVGTFDAAHTRLLGVDAAGNVVEVENPNSALIKANDDANAATLGIAIGDSYVLANTNTFGLPEGMIKIRVV